MGKRLTCAVLFFACSAALALALAAGPQKPGVAIRRDALDQLLADLAAATSKLDIAKAERLFLPPDDTPAGENRQGHLSEMRKDWKRARESGAAQGPSVRFKNTRKVVLTQMVIRGPGGPREGQAVHEVEFTVAFTQDGWKIVSMEEQRARHR